MVNAPAAQTDFGDLGGVNTLLMDLVREEYCASRGLEDKLPGVEG